MARKGSVLVATFHPELTDDPAVHEYFCAMVRKARVGVRAAAEGEASLRKGVRAAAEGEASLRKGVRAAAEGEASLRSGRPAGSSTTSTRTSRPRRSSGSSA